MQLEVGKYYKTRDGRKVGPMLRYGRVVEGYEAFHTGPESGSHWRASDGLSYPENNVSEIPSNDLIAEWHDEPARTTLSAIDHLRKAAELFLADGNDKAAFDVLGVVLDHE